MRRRMLLTSVSLGCALALLSAGPASPRAVAQGAGRAPQPISLAVVYDTSVLAGHPKGGRASFKGKKALFSALAEFIKQADPRNEYFVIRFDTVPRLLLGAASDRESALKVISKLSSVKPDGATSLFDACLLAVDQVARGKHDRRAIILVSDGVDTVSKHKLKDVTEALAGSGIALYAINIGIPDLKRPSLNSYPLGDEALGRMASASNGMLFRFAGDEGKVEIFQTIAAKLNDDSPGRPR